MDRHTTWQRWRPKSIKEDVPILFSERNESEGNMKGVLKIIFIYFKQSFNDGSLQSFKA